MHKVVIVGSGNVALHLAKAFAPISELTLVATISRNATTLEGFKSYGRTYTKLDANLKTDLFLIAVNDASIVDVSRQLAGTKAMVVHTSGSTPMQVLKEHPNHGVFYPLQTFSRGRDVEFKQIPICLEANSSKNLNKLSQIAGLLSINILKIDGLSRQKLHLSAVISNNFTNHLVYLAQDIIKDENLSYQVLLPLLEETVIKLHTITPFAAQTGPARRGDIQTMTTQLEKITNKRLKEVYILLSKSIQETYEREL